MSEYSKIMRLCSCEFGSFFLKNKFWHQINKKKVLCCIDLVDFRIEDKVCENLSNSFWGSVTRSGDPLNDVSSSSTQTTPCRAQPCILAFKNA